MNNVKYLLAFLISSSVLFRQVLSVKYPTVVLKSRVLCFRQQQKGLIFRGIGSASQGLAFKLALAEDLTSEELSPKTHNFVCKMESVGSLKESIGNITPIA